MSSNWGILIILLLFLGGAFWYLAQSEQEAGRAPLQAIGADLRRFIDAVGD